jgi:hypothetical protein
MRLWWVCLLLAGCSTTWDPHAPRTITAPESGGEVEVKHGQRLQVKLPAAAQGGEWRLREPVTPVVIAEGAPAPDGIRMTPVRSGEEVLRFEDGQRSVSYRITVP